MQIREFVLQFNLMYIIHHKFNVKDIYEFAKKVKTGELNESQGFDEFSNWTVLLPSKINSNYY